MQIYVCSPLCLSKLVCVCVCVCVLSGQSACSLLLEADAWSKWVISFMSAVLLEVGLFPKALTRFLPSSLLSLFFFISQSFLRLSFAFLLRPACSAYLHHLWESQITAKIGSFFFSFFFSFFLNIFVPFCRTRWGMTRGPLWLSGAY